MSMQMSCVKPAVRLPSTAVDAECFLGPAADHRGRKDEFDVKVVQREGTDFESARGAGLWTFETADIRLFYVGHG
jgi:hypothetical protein